MGGVKAKRPDGGNVYHGGCHQCVTPQEHCDKCMYFKRPWSRPDYSSKNLINKALGLKHNK
jgi:hypothetical protein